MYATLLVATLSIGQNVSANRFASGQDQLNRRNAEETLRVALKTMPRDEKLRLVVAKYNESLKRPVVDANWHRAKGKLDRTRSKDYNAALAKAKGEIESLGLKPTPLTWKQIEADLMGEFSR